MILNHKSAIEYILESAEEEKIDSYHIRSIHGILSENLLGDPSASGKLREISVGIGGSSYMPLENPHALQENFDLFIKKLNLIKDPFEQSFFALIYLSYLQAFEDVNKRTARIVANIPLIKSNLRPLSFVDVEQDAYILAMLGFYEKNDISLVKDLYLWAYKRSCERYSAIQDNIAEPNKLKMKYRGEIQHIVRTIVQENTPGNILVKKVKKLIQELEIPKEDSKELFNIIEVEIASLHEGNIARFKIRPSEFESWKTYQR
jgi:hypothetical protein